MTIALIALVLYLAVALWLAEVPWRDVLGCWGIPIDAAPTWHARLRAAVPWWVVVFPLLIGVGSLLQAGVWAGRKVGFVAQYRKYGYVPQATPEKDGVGLAAELATP